jgi:hypothetical protein
MRRKKRPRSIYVLSPEDADRIDHLIGVLSMAITELMIAKRVAIPDSPEYLPAETQLMDEAREISMASAAKQTSFEF